MSLIQTAEGSLTEVSNMLNRMRELSVQASNDTNNQNDRAKIAEEVTALLTEIDSISSRTKFNDKALTAAPANGNTAFDGTFQVGANSGETINLKIDAMSVAKLGITVDANNAANSTGIAKAFGIQGAIGAYKVDTTKIGNGAANFVDAITTVDAAIEKVSTQRSKLGATQNRLEYTINNLNLSSENLSAAKSRIEDADMAKEMMNLTSANVLQQAATSMLAQANQAPNNITQLLG